VSYLQLIDKREVLGKNLRIYGTIEEPLFLAKDVAEWIEHSDVSAMIRNIDENEKTKMIIPSEYCSEGIQSNTEYWFLTEDGLYEVLMQSRKAIAKEFKKKVKQILKDIRKHGIYATDKVIEEMLNDPDTMIKTLQALKEEKQKVIKLSERLEEQDKKLEFFRNLQRLNEMLRASDIGMRYGITAQEFNRIMQHAGVIKKVDNNINGRNPYYVMTAEYSHTKYCQVITDTLKNGIKIKTNVWLPESLEFIDSIMQSYGHKFVV